MKAVTIGDNCMDVYLSRQESYPGGNPVNVAVYLKQLGLDVSYIGWVGSDEYGRQMTEAIGKRGVDLSRLHIKDGHTAITFVELQGNDRVFGEYREGVMEKFRLTPEDLEFAASHQLVHAGIWGRCESCFPQLHAMGLITSFDFADRLEREIPPELLASVDYPFFSYSQDDAYIREYLKEMQAKGAKAAIATLGENGALAYDGERYYKEAAREVAVVDTMGAGDSFIAGFLYGIVQRLPLAGCLEQGTSKAARTITYFGAW